MRHKYKERRRFIRSVLNRIKWISRIEVFLAALLFFSMLLMVENLERYDALVLAIIAIIAISMYIRKKTEERLIASVKI